MMVSAKGFVSTEDDEAWRDKAVKAAALEPVRLFPSKF
jgi:hypothetical protein